MRGRYYLGRVVKKGLLDQEKLIQTLLAPPIVEVGKFEWTITDVVDGLNEEIPFLFGKLSKYAKRGHVKIVDENSRLQVDAVATNLLEASSPFVYLPEFSGLAFLHAWNGVTENLFPKRFKAIVERAFNEFFVSCDVEPIADYKEFVEKLSTINRFTELNVKVYPPNPMFGRLWGSLNDYVKRRSAAEVQVKEVSANGINTDIIYLLQQIMKDPKFEPAQEPDITDAAILMAADGYGKGRISGYEGDSEVIIRTSDSQKSFLFSKDPIPHDLAKAAYGNFLKVKRERNMNH